MARRRLFPILLALVLFSIAAVSTGCSDEQSHAQEETTFYFPLVTLIPDKYYVTGRLFEAMPLDLEDFRLFDLGVTDLNDDGALDLFTANHSARQSFLPNNGQGHFLDNALTPYRLDQVPDFPGLEDSDHTPVFSEPGLYIYWHKSVMVFRAHKIESLSDEISGSLAFIPEISVGADDGFEYSLSSEMLPNGVVQTILDFTALDDGVMHVTPLPKPAVGSPIPFELDVSANLNHVFIGIANVNPSDHSFQLQLKDRHGMAWFDYNDDGRLDVYMSRGGNRGESDLFPEELIIDEFYLNGATHFNAVPSDSLGFVKDDCAGRQVAPVDFNADGRLDLYIVCAQRRPNQLFRQEANGQFVNVADALDLGLRDDGHVVWLDADDDLDADMFWAGTQEYRLYVNQGGMFVSQKIMDVGDRAEMLTVGDFDLDGDPDIYAASPTASILFHNNMGTYVAQSPEVVGLPVNTLTANWVDYDNDGLLDLHVIPGGIYRQLPQHTFQSTGILRLETALATANEARASWFDADGDGRRDFVVSTYLSGSDSEGEIESEWFSGYFRNIVDSGNNWLALRLVGLVGNREAIGASVTVQAGNEEYTQQVGWSEGARYSQGHYRLYFGLGSNQVVDRITITWSNGVSQVLEDIPVNNLLTVQQSP